MRWICADSIRARSLDRFIKRPDIWEQYFLAKRIFYLAIRGGSYMPPLVYIKNNLFLAKNFNKTPLLTLF